jgi:hypothetical protein
MKIILTVRQFSSKCIFIEVGISLRVRIGANIDNAHYLIDLKDGEELIKCFVAVTDGIDFV